MIACGVFSACKKDASVNKPIFATLAPYISLLPAGKCLFFLPLAFNKSKYKFLILVQKFLRPLEYMQQLQKTWGELGILGVSCSGQEPLEWWRSEFYNLFPDEKVSRGEPPKLSTRDKTVDLVSGHSTEEGPQWTDPIIRLASSQAVWPPYHFLVGEESVRQCRAVRGRWCDN